MALANLSSILHVLILLLLINLSHSVPIITEAQLIPSGFSCTQDMPRQQGIYSTPSNSNLIKVDLIHMLCGQIYSSSTTDNSLKSSVRVGGFHARPGNTDPASASTANSQQTRTPPNVYGYAVYKYPYVYDVQRGTYIKKNTGSVSSIWPTVLSMEEIVEIITELVYLCSPSQSKHLCVSNFTLLPGNSNAELFDVVIILRNNNKVVRSGYPTARGTCSGKSSNSFSKCSLNSTMLRDHSTRIVR